MTRRLVKGAVALSEQLAHPPLVEALCEVLFTSTTAWDWTIPGRLYERLADQFPEKFSVPTLGFTTQIAQVAQPPVVIQANPDRVQFKRADGSALVQIAPQLLAINHLLPYPGWDTFSGIIRDVLANFAEIAPSAAPARIALRYINRLPLENSSLDEVRSYVTITSPISESAGVRFSSFYQRFEFASEDPIGTLIHQTAKQVTPDGQTALVLDLEFQSVQGTVSTLSDAPAIHSWLDAAHARIESAFLDSLTPDRLNEMRGV